MNALDVLCAQLTRDLFAIAKFLLTINIGRLLFHCWYSIGRPVTIGTPMVIFAVLTRYSINFSSRVPLLDASSAGTRLLKFIELNYAK